MKLPNIDQSNHLLNNHKKFHSLIKQKYKIIQGKDNDTEEFKVDSFLNKMKEIKEIRIYLKENFSKNEIDNVFMKDIEKEYAEQYLLKMKMFPTKKLIKKVLKICPLQNCDFELLNECTYVNNREKLLKVIHIFPVFDRKEKIKTIRNTTSFNSGHNTSNSIEHNASNNFHTLTSTENNLFFDRLHFRKGILKKSDRNINNKKNHLSIETSPKIVKYFGTGENFKYRNGLSQIKTNNNSINTNTGFLYNREKIDDMLVKNRETVVNLQLYSNKKSLIKIDLSPENIKEKYISSESNWSTQMYEKRGKLSRLSKSILTCKNVLNNEKYFFLLSKLEDLNTEILDEVNEPIKAQIELIIKDINYILDNFPIEDFIQVKNSENLKTNKITINNNEELLKILKIISSNDSCRIIGLCLNLIYWIIFGGNAHIQIDNNTKECLYLKLMKEWENIGNKFGNKNLFYKVYIPLFIIICRIEIENLLTRRYIQLFQHEKAKVEILKRANAIISEIFDKHGYMNSFNLLCGNQTEFNKKFNPNYLPRYKNKLYATSNFVVLLFRNEKSGLRTDSFDEIKAKKSFIMKQKADYFNYYLNKMNNHLKRRNLEPIFKIKKVENEEEDNNKKNIILNRKELSLSRINKKEKNENMKIVDYMEKTKQDYIKSFSNLKKYVSHYHFIFKIL